MSTSDYWKRLSGQRLSRRRVLAAGAAGVGATALGLAGCGGGEDEDGETPTVGGTPQYGGGVTTGITADPGGLDPQICITCYWIAAQFHGYLYNVSIADQSIMLQMASGYEHVDDVTYVWNLRPGIKFHDVDPTFGREVIADDIVYSMTRRRDDPAVLNDKQLLRDYTASFDAPDQYSFRLVTNRPYSPAYDELGNTSYAIVPKEAVEKYGDLQQHAIGCGAFLLDEFVKSERVKMRRNPNFYMEGRPYLDTRQWLIIPDMSTIMQAFRTGQHDIYGSSLDKLKADELKGIKGMVVRDTPNLVQKSLNFNVEKPPFNDKRVWNAIDLAINRQDLIDKMAFGAGKVAGPIAPDLEYWALPQEELRDFYKLDLVGAKQLLAAAGYPDGFEVDLPVMTVVDMPRLGEVIKEQLAKIDVTCNLQPKELGSFIAQVYGRNFEMALFYNLGYVEPDRPLCQWFSKGQSGASLTGYNNPEMDDWIWKERSEFDIEKRRQIVLDAQRAMMREHGPVINTFTGQGYMAHWDWVGGTDDYARVFSQWGYLGVDLWVKPH